MFSSVSIVVAQGHGSFFSDRSAREGGMLRSAGGVGEQATRNAVQYTTSVFIYSLAMCYTSQIFFSDGAVGIVDFLIDLTLRFLTFRHT